MAPPRRAETEAEAGDADVEVETKRKSLLKTSAQDTLTHSLTHSHSLTSARI